MITPTEALKRFLRALFFSPVMNECCAVQKAAPCSQKTQADRRECRTVRQAHSVH